VTRFSVRGVPVEHYGWIIQRTGCIVTSDFQAIAALDSKGIIRGMVGYCNWSGNTVQCHMAVDHPIAWRALVYENNAPAFWYPFVQSKRKLILALVHEGNNKSLEMTRHLGFREAHRIRDGVRDGEDLVLFEMRREDCPWLSRADQVPARPHKPGRPSATLGRAMEAVT